MEYIDDGPAWRWGKWSLTDCSPGPQPHNRIGTSGQQFARIFQPRPRDLDTLTTYRDLLHLREELSGRLDEIDGHIDAIAEKLLARRAG